MTMNQGAGLLIVTPNNQAWLACYICHRLREVAAELRFKVEALYITSRKELGTALLQLVSDVKAGKVVLILAASADDLLKGTELAQAVREELMNGTLHIVTLDRRVNTFQGLEAVARYDWEI